MRSSSAQSARRSEALFRFRGAVPKLVLDRMPELKGRSIHVSFRPKLTAYRGKLLSKSHKGDSVYAGSFLRKRRIVLDEHMLRTPRVLNRIFVHEVFHFVWSKAGNSLRESYEVIICSEFDQEVSGELGWSAESLKLRLSPSDRKQRSRRWRDYLCESFCDTAAWYFGAPRRYSEMTLDRACRAARRRWVIDNLVERQQPLAI